MLLLVHVSVCDATLAGVTVAVSLNCVPSSTDAVVRSSVIELARILFTVTAQVAFRLEPSVVATVIVAVPGVSALTTPVASTVATAVLLLVHVSVCDATLAGVTVAVSLNCEPSSTDTEVRSSVIVLARILVPVTAQVAFRLEPSVVATVIVAVPCASTFTNPVASTVATALLLLVHVSVCDAALSGFTVAVSLNCEPSSTDTEVRSSVIDCASCSFRNASYSASVTSFSSAGVPAGTER